ncbi:sperm axonemal maintenance protein CFAP97D1-like [Liolophura sinensis]|uniref:sperm axonemal maintenance protein CFAP97D1-like n=1 Tax=Liolophura sinensis TaxID=3198878 RepID=UPI003158A05A
MHRSYQPITPTNNIFLRKRWDQQRYQAHRDKVRKSVAVLDTHPPRTYMHLHVKLTKLQKEDNRLAIIERDNRILLEKMANIMQTYGGVDNKNNYKQKSLNRTQRQRELLRITHENIAILKRITTKEPHYCHLRYEADYKAHKQYLLNITRYPQNMKKKNFMKLTEKQSKNQNADKESDKKIKKQANDLSDKED